jgi:hypothetical protein
MCTDNSSCIHTKQKIAAVLVHKEKIEAVFMITENCSCISLYKHDKEKIEAVFMITENSSCIHITKNSSCISSYIQKMTAA